MTKLIYRGVAYEAGQNKTNTEQNAANGRVYRRPQLVYRGVAHNGVRTLERAGHGDSPMALFYRGFRTA